MKIILDACCNHLGNKDIIMQMINIANSQGIDYIKFQLYDIDKLNPWYKDYVGVKSRLEKSNITYEYFKEIIEYCEYLDIKPMFTIYDLDKLAWFEEDITGIEDLAFKIASSNANDEDFIYRVVDKAEQLGCPVVISHGMSKRDEITKIRYTFDKSIHLYCVSKYPTIESDIDWEYMKTFDGFSDHTIGVDITNKIGFGYKDVKLDWYEKHFTISRYLPGKDHAISIEPGEIGLFKRNLEYRESVENYKTRYVK